MATELEIKLTLSEAALAQAWRWLLAHPNATQGPEKLLINRYFDTPDAAFNRARAALRVRKAGDRYIQTLKTQGEFVNGAHRRQEWEWDLPGPDLDLALLVDTPLMQQVALDDLACVFETNFRRRIVMLEGGGSSVEVAVDSGEVVAGDQVLPLHEVEFELKGGSPSILAKQAMALAGAVPVFLNLVSKAEQGYYLAGVHQPEATTLSQPPSAVNLLRALSFGWLTGQSVQVPAPWLAALALPQADDAVLASWAQARVLLAEGIKVPALLARLPAFGKVQLALALSADT
ncbi:CYTH domain-containing protein [Marinobacter fuscus]|uniref:CYTH domain-containing protein n=1 Tax=Marinobacter fuscus TaxID=2109942 RepID=A0A2T1K662_9GAMM|nr:CYTH domain-containing protein [Marinobacter fuscus]PSF05587.1 CYTH domain-containing protein [Marinobacter fuscus]